MCSSCTWWWRGPVPNASELKWGAGEPMWHAALAGRPTSSSVRSFSCQYLKPRFILGITANGLPGRKTKELAFPPRWNPPHPGPSIALHPIFIVCGFRSFKYSKILGQILSLIPQSNLLRLKVSRIDFLRSKELYGNVDYGVPVSPTGNSQAVRS